MNSSIQGTQSIEEFDLEGQRVFIRLDLNVPMKDGKITDDTRIQAALPTIQYAVDHGAKVILASHLGRPKGPEDRKRLSLEPVAERLNQLLDMEVLLIDEPKSEAPKSLLNSPMNNQIILLENLRFHPDETKNGHGLAQQISSYVDIYINDAFGASHRSHSSVVALPSMIQKRGLGFLMKREIEMLDKLAQVPGSPYVVILGGAKVSDKIELIENLIEKVDTFIIGGAMAYTFLESQGISVGSSLVEKDKVWLAGELFNRIKTRGKRLLLPVDHVVTPHLNQESCAEVTPTVVIPEGLMGVDIGPKTIELYSKEIDQAKVIFWNGPMGIFERPAYSRGTFSLAKEIAEASAFTLIGGGDSASAVKASGFADKIDHISTGGGASMEYIQGTLLPGLKALKS